MRAILVSFALTLLALAPAGAADSAVLDAWSAQRALAETSPFRGLPWRSVGPIVMGGRIVDVESVPGAPYTFYVAYASGGLWKTENNGASFEPVFDGNGVQAIVELAVVSVAIDGQQYLGLNLFEAVQDTMTAKIG